MRTLLAILLTLLAFAVSANEKETLEFGKEKFPAPQCGAPYAGDLSSGVVTLLPDDVACFAVSISDGQVRLDRPSNGAPPEALLVLRLWYDPQSGKSYLTIHNPLDKFLTYKAHLLRAGSSTREYTTTCQVLSRRDGMEWWSYQISEITLAAFSVSPEAPTIECN